MQAVTGKAFLGKGFILLFVCLSGISGTAHANDGQVQFFHPDHLGSANSTTDAIGSVIQLQSHTPFGEISYGIQNAKHDSRFQYTGQELDRESDLYDYGARYYDPILTRFITVDPMEGNSPYAYALSNPIHFVDPTGGTPESAVWVLYDLGMAAYYKYRGDNSGYLEYLIWAGIDAAFTGAPPGASAVAHAAGGLRAMAEVRGAYTAARSGIEVAIWMNSSSGSDGSSGKVVPFVSLKRRRALELQERGKRGRPYYKNFMVSLERLGRNLSFSNEAAFRENVDKVRRETGLLANQARGAGIPVSTPEAFPHLDFESMWSEWQSMLGETGSLRIRLLERAEGLSFWATSDYPVARFPQDHPEQLVDFLRWFGDAMGPNPVVDDCMREYMSTGNVGFLSTIEGNTQLLNDVNQFVQRHQK